MELQRFSDKCEETSKQVSSLIMRAREQGEKTVEEVIRARGSALLRLDMKVDGCWGQPYPENCEE